MKAWSLIIAATFAACGGPDPRPGANVPVEAGADASPLPLWQRTERPVVADNIRHDTLLVQVTFAMGDGTHLMVAQHATENKEGLRLVLYRARPDSSADVIATSKPGYDSMTMFPVFFTSGNPADGLIVLANMGEKQSWGQEVFLLKDRSFQHLGFLDVAVRSWKMDGDSSYQFRGSIAPSTSVSGSGGEFVITFIGDSLQLYDDLRGNYEVMLPASGVSYRTHDGQLRLVLENGARDPS